MEIQLVWVVVTGYKHVKIHQDVYKLQIHKKEKIKGGLPHCKSLKISRIMVLKFYCLLESLWAA